MTTTLNPTITITVSGPTGSGKSRVLALIVDVLKLIHGDCIIDAPDVKAEKEMCGNDYTAWHKPRSGTIFKLNEINLPINTGRCIYREMATAINKLADAQENRVETEGETRKKIQAAITTDDLLDRPVPVHIQALMSKLGISFEEYQETSLQPVVDLVNWALTTPQVSAIPPAPDAGVNRLFGVTAGSRRLYTLSTDALSSRDALEKIEKAINRMKNDPRSHFAEGEANIMVIDGVRATSVEKE
ncbi:hypothetical protein DQR17_23025 [Salmonella enterica subsp. enterica serovar Bovismorbificans]|nr:hypothetical protein [Salmonella enterica subsp. enterica serovar Bovismorbificans]ECB3341815.1 hypothetical protein [Salmonella enterica subsp. enterica serovar Bovismorbificans]